MTGDESWFVYLYLSDHMFASGRENVIPRQKQTIAPRKIMLTIFFSGTSLISLDALPHGQRYTQKYFIDNILPDLVKEKRRIRRQNQMGQFFVHMDNSMCHNGKIITRQISDAKFERFPDPASSPDLSPCNFWLFGMLKQKVKDRAFQRVEEILEAGTLLWNEVTFEQLQSVFLNWMERLEWVISNGGDYYIN
jgi:hypothetical protein